tara:strand:- start:3248 stop:3727 length:480 start_codon:yes stop_codon:yes gene_type:complete
MSFNVVIDSNDRIAGNANNDILKHRYALDWSFLEQSEDYELTFSFVISGEKSYESLYDFTCIALTGLGTQIMTYKASGSTDAKNSNVIGLVERDVFSRQDVNKMMTFRASPANVPVILKGRPSNNLFQVDLLKNSTEFATNALTASNEYILILHFNKKD